MRVSLQYAETHLADLLDVVDAGEMVEIARLDKPSVVLQVHPEDSMTEAKAWKSGERSRGELFGALKDQIVLGDEWDSPQTNAEIAALFEQSTLFPERSAE
jgi:antitoxin (DNA-binding transcriptional repressor) of toxin-antitoxin stability system